MLTRTAAQLARSGDYWEQIMSGTHAYTHKQTLSLSLSLSGPSRNTKPTNDCCPFAHWNNYNEWPAAEGKGQGSHYLKGGVAKMDTAEIG